MSKGIENIRREFVSGFLPEMAYRLNISKEDRFRIDTTREMLDKNPHLNFILYFNHISYNDPLLAGYIVQQIDPKHTRYLISPASFSNTDPRNPNSLGSRLALEEAERCGVEVVRVIQAYQVDNPKYGYTGEQAMATYRIWIKRLNQLRSSGTPTGCIISPEGHRSDNGALGPGEAGITTIGRFLAPVVYIPVGISYFDDYGRSDLNLGKRINLSIGNIIFQENPKEHPGLDDIMSNLAEALPPDMRGQWSE